jgi:hypothetical protein
MIGPDRSGLRAGLFRRAGPAGHAAAQAMGDRNGALMGVIDS